MSKRCKISYKNKLYKKVCIKDSRHISSTNTIVKIQQTRDFLLGLKMGNFSCVLFPGAMPHIAKKIDNL